MAELDYKIAAPYTGKSLAEATGNITLLMENAFVLIKNIAATDLELPEITTADINYTEFEFEVGHASELKITVPGGSKIKYRDIESVTGGYFASSVVGNKIKLTPVSTTEWLAKVVGVWDVDGSINIDDYSILNGANGSNITLKTITEEIEIAKGVGVSGVTSSTHLAPENSLILAVAFYVTDAPGGGATTLDIGRTNGGNLDEFIDGASCTTLGKTGNSAKNNDGTVNPIYNASNDTFTLTTDANVSGDLMKVRVVVWYYDIVVPSS